MDVRKKSAAFLSHVAYYIELLVAFLLLGAVVILLFELVIESGLFTFSGNHLDFDSFLSGAFNLIIGVEFTKMLCRHTPETVVEVLLFAVARQIVIAHSSVWETFMGVAAIAGLFAVKRFLIPGSQARKPIVSEPAENPEKKPPVAP